MMAHPYGDTKFAVLGLGHMGEYQRVCYEHIVGDKLSSQVIFTKATDRNLDYYKSVLPCEIIVGDNMEALKKMRPDVILVCPPPSQIPPLVTDVLKPYCEEQRAAGGTMPDIISYGPTPSVDFFYDELGDDINAVKLLPNMFYKIGDTYSAYLEVNYLTFSEDHPWPKYNYDRLYEFLSPLVNTTEVPEWASVLYLGIRNAGHCAREICFGITDTLNELGYNVTTQQVASVARAALRREWSDMPKEFIPCSYDELDPKLADFVGKTAVNWAKGFTDYAVSEGLPEGAGDLVRRTRFEVHLITVQMQSREEVEKLKAQHSTKGGVSEKSMLTFMADCMQPMQDALRRYLDGTLEPEWWDEWRHKAEHLCRTVANHGKTLSDKK